MGGSLYKDIASRGASQLGIGVRGPPGTLQARVAARPCLALRLLVLPLELLLLLLLLLLVVVVVVVVLVVVIVLGEAVEGAAD